MVRVLLVVACGLVAGCSSAPKAPAVEESGPAKAAQPPPVSTPAPLPSSADSSGAIVYTLEDAGRRQNVELRKRDGGAFNVAISVSGGCSRAEAGIAKAIASEGDVEVEEDPEGEGHPTDEFVLVTDGKCRVRIRVAAPEQDFVWLRESDCANSCPLSSKPMVRK